MDDEWMTQPSGPFYVTLPDGGEQEFHCRADLFRLLDGMSRDDQMNTTVRTGFALAPHVLREDDGEYIRSLLALHAAD